MQNKKIAGYIRAKKLIDAGATQTDACAEAGISRMTFNKYRNLFGDEVSENLVEVLPKEKKAAPVVERRQSMSDLDRLKEENAALAEQLKLRQELAKYVH